MLPSVSSPANQGIDFFNQEVIQYSSVFLLLNHRCLKWHYLSPITFKFHLFSNLFQLASQFVSLIHRPILPHAFSFDALSFKPHDLLFLMLRSVQKSVSLILILWLWMNPEPHLIFRDTASMTPLAISPFLIFLIKTLSSDLPSTQ